MQRHCWILLLTLLAAFSVSAVADTLYVYTGNPYTNFNICITDTCYATNVAGYTGLTITLVLPSSLPANMGMTAITPSSFGFNDGRYQLNGWGTGGTFSVATDGSGNISLWTITIEETTLFGVRYSCDPTYTGYRVSTSNAIDRSTCGHVLHSGELTVPVMDQALVAEHPGTWARIENVPEPGTGLLLAIGIAAVMKRKKVG